MKAMLEREARSPGRVVDRIFIAEQTEGYDALVVALQDFFILQKDGNRRGDRHGCPQREAQQFRTGA